MLTPPKIDIIPFNPLERKLGGRSQSINKAIPILNKAKKASIFFKS